MVIKLHGKVRIFASYFLAGIAGSAIGAILPDSDHLIEGQARTWGHDWRFPCFLFAVVFLALACRYVRSRVLR